MPETFEGFIQTNVDPTAAPLTTESLKQAFEKAYAQSYEPHRHLFSPRCRTEDGIYHCIDCGAGYEFRSGQPVMSY